MIELPKTKSKVSNYDPKLLILYGKPKSGKSTIVSCLENNLIIDLEDGYRSLSVLKVLAKNWEDLKLIAKAIREETVKEKGLKPYKFVTIDNASRLEEFALTEAKALYRKTPMGANWGYKINPKTGKKEDDLSSDIRTLPQGAGYMYIRMAIKKLLDVYKTLADTLILVAHVKDKMINVNGTDVSEFEVDLAGKMGSIVCGEADAIGLIYRKDKNTYISFRGGENTIKEARPLHLRGKEFKVISSDDDGNITVNLDGLFINQ